MGLRKGKKRMIVSRNTSRGWENSVRNNDCKKIKTTFKPFCV
jgi:hypothetical protein